ncbi:transcriptional regulator [Sphingobium fuliginis]|uniref:Transcriptional regulator n=1 Tax=Sphingobium fuliginis (strain ATCC 27551) TaxID=336203 RepID=A0A7M2GIM3_SPHSA|nr:helix-turn-helix domain-containing protein [Sphingobium fuliginis]QOT72265.1 transcriptional regulator [Sphingobium fuliginis]
MSLQSTSGIGDAAVLAQIKLISGKCIEERRRKERKTQEQLASDVGIGVRWLREIESGNPKSSIEDHLRCASGVGLPASYFLIPLMFMDHKMTFPRQLLLDDVAALEEYCIRCIGDYYVDTISSRLRPSASKSSPPEAEA